MLIEFLGLKKHGIPHVHKILNFVLQRFKPMMHDKHFNIKIHLAFNFIV
jgi:hypothetical protein